MFNKSHISLGVRVTLLLVLTMSMLGLQPANSVRADTIIVTNTNDSGPGSLREAIYNAVFSGDIVTFDPSLAGATITLNSEIYLLLSSWDLTIDGSGLNPPVVVSGGNTSRIMNIIGDAKVTISNVAFTQGFSTGSGGAMEFNGSIELFLENCAFYQNQASSSGGAISVGGTSTITIVNSTFQENRAGGSGGAISSGGSGLATIVGSTFSGNSAGGDGGAILAGNVILMDSTLSGNIASGDGGALLIAGNGHGAIVNSTVFENQAGESGGGMIVMGNQHLDIYNSTFASNTAPQGNEFVLSGNALLNLGNTIFVCTAGDNNCYIVIGPITVNTNHSFLGSGALSDYGLAGLANNGGSTQTMALLPGSPLIDAGDDSICANADVNNLDQRGVPRPQGSHCDIGAYEDQSLVRFVKQDATGTNDGSSWSNAHTDLQSALAAAVPDEEIWVAAGTYKPTSGTDRTISFTLKNGVAVYSGFAGTETSRDQRDYETNLTVLSGDIGVQDDNSDNSYHVVVGSNTNNSAILDGFRVTAGNANDGISHSGGGGMYNETGSPTLANLRFIDNFATFGGGIYNLGSPIPPENGSHPVLNNVIFQNNSAIGGGGAMRNENYSNPILTNVVFENNSVDRTGGGIENFYYSSPILTDVSFINNTAGASGGGMFNWIGNDPELTNVTFSGNTAQWGGGMGNYQSSPVLTNVVFNINLATWYGGGMSNEDNSNPTLMNVTFHSNTAASNAVETAAGGMHNRNSSPSLNNVTFSNNSASEIGGGVVNESSSSPLLINVTFSNNSADYGGAIVNRDANSSPFLAYVTLSNNTAAIDGGAIAVNGGHMTIRHGILWGNTGSEIFNISSGTVAVVNSIVQGGYPGTGNLDADPLLGPLQDNGGFTQTMALGAGSPAIDAGDASNCPATDQRGVTRPQGSGCDIGAYEVEIPNSAPKDISLSSSSVNENQPAGTTVGSLSTTDSDAWNTHTYAFCGGTDDASFSIAGNLLKTTSVFDYEAKTSYIVCIRSTDSGGLSTTETFVIGVNDLIDTETFTDVSSVYWAWNFIERLYTAGITGGCNVNPLEYCPESTVTRAQMAVFLLRGIHGSSYNPPPVGASTGFGDVEPTYWAGAWIKQLAAEGITGGCGNGNYCPEAPVTRAQMAVFLLRAKYGSSYGPPAVGSSTGFGDVEPTYWAAAWIKQLAAEGITGGCGSGNYCPETSVTRAQMAVFLVRTFNLP